MSCVSLQVLRVGFCRHLECISARGGRWAPIEFPALCGLIHHSTAGYILFDTGYADHFHAATAYWPERLYAKALPVTLAQHETLKAQLAARGLSPADIGTIIISHHHGDHIAGLRDFPHTNLIAMQSGISQMRQLSGKRWHATLHGHLPALLPDDYFQRVRAVEDSALNPLPAWLSPFQHGFDLLGDGSLIGIALPGHDHGQLGLFMPNVNGRPVWMIADACWSLPALLEHRMPPFGSLLHANRRQFEQTFHNLGILAKREPDVALLPSHCTFAWKQFSHDS